MGIWKKLFGGDTEQAVDYYREGVELARVGSYHEALTSFRLALRESPSDTAVLQEIAMVYTRIGMTDDAMKTYRTVLAQNADASGAHYGLAFLLLHEGRKEEAKDHLRRFLATPPEGPEAGKHIEHAKKTLDELTAPPKGD